MTQAKLYDLLIIGAGIGGLSLAYRLAERGKRVLVAEKMDRAGGVVTTVQRGEFLLEKGPNSFSSGDAMMTLIDDIGLGKRTLAQPIRDHDRFVWKAGRLRKVPMGPIELLKSDVLTFGEKLRLVRGLFKAGAPLEKDIELGRFFRDRLGDAVVETLLKPFMAGVYASDADRISFEATLPKLYRAAHGGGSLVSSLKAMRRANPRPPGPRKPRCLVSFPDGLKELAEALTGRIREAGSEVRVGDRIALERGAGARWTVRFADGTAGESDVVVMTSAAGNAAALLDPHAPSVSSFLRSIEYAALTIAHVGIRDDQCTVGGSGFGFLTVDGQGVDMLGAIWSSNIFPGRAPAGHRLLTCFFGGEKHSEANTWSDDTLRARLEADLKTTMGFRGGDFPLLEITRWEKALPIFRVGHRQRLDEAVASLPEGVHLLANYLGSVSMPDRVEQAAELLARLSNSQKIGVAP